jgi:TonB family protein
MTYPATTGKLKLAGFVIASACLHLALLGLKTPHASIDLGDASRSVIAVEMREQAAAETLPPRARNRTQASNETVAQTRTLGQTPRQSTTPKADNAPAIPPQVHREAILGRIHRDISRYFYYPPQALRRGWQGTVLVRLRLLPSGRIDSVHLASGSGHSVLDRAALDSVEKIRQIAMSDLHIGTGLDLQIPVIFRLTGG